MKIKELQEKSPVGFGTSGVRGLVLDMTDYVCYHYVAAFLQYIEVKAGDKIVIAGDLRESTERIMKASAKAATDMDVIVINGGRIPSPAVANYGIMHNLPTIMVTGSHIPSDRNGIKFTLPSGEISKEDEGGILSQDVTVSLDLFDSNGYFKTVFELPEVNIEVKKSYINRYLSVFPKDFLRGFDLAVYSHSSVGRDILIEIYQRLGARVTEIARSEKFIPVDTEAIREEDVELAHELKNKYDAILSTDGDCDRPLIAAENGEWLRGDILGILAAKYLNASGVATPVSCNTALEKSNWFTDIKRTPIGSPYVIAGMDLLVNQGLKTVVGYEANGGFFTNTPMILFGKMLPPLPTRDPVICHLAILGTAKMLKLSLSELSCLLPQRATYSDRLKEVPKEYTSTFLKMLATAEQNLISNDEIKSTDLTDGVRFTLNNEDIIHLRGSGNAPELRCYAESDCAEKAKKLVIKTLLKVNFS